LPGKTADGNQTGGLMGSGKRYCPQLNFSLESKLTFLSKKYARIFLLRRMRRIIAAMIDRLQKPVRFAIFI
jgi:hypothetical protein